jgi:hypothetical protein
MEMWYPGTNCTMTCIAGVGVQACICRHKCRASGKLRRRRETEAREHGVITADECGGCAAQSAHVLSCIVLPSGDLYSA